MRRSSATRAALLARLRARQGTGASRAKAGPARPPRQWRRSRARASAWRKRCARSPAPRRCCPRYRRARCHVCKRASPRSTPQRKLAVQGDDGPLVESLPLLHLAAGGRSPRALYALATSAAGSQELAGILGVEHEGATSTPDSARVTIVRELSTRAALDFLRDRAADVALPGKGTALACRLVARAALAVGRRDLVLGARELLLSVEPNSENRLDFAAELARSGEPSAPRRCCSKRRPASRLPPATLASTQRLIVMARVATAPEASTDVASKLLRARAWLRLGRTTEARALLERETEPAKARLDLAAALAEASIDQPSCPDLPPDVGGAALCAVAFRASESVKHGRALLEAAWQAGAGRDDEAVEVYTALAHVIPWMHAAASDLAQGALRTEESVARVAALQAELSQIALVAPKMAGLALFLETVHADPSKRALGPADRRGGTRPGSARAHARLRRTKVASRRRACWPWPPCFRTNATSRRCWSRCQPSSTAPGLRLPRAALEVWMAASTGSREHLESARAELATIMAESLGGPLERARLVLGVSEVGALLDSSERSYQLLSRVSGQLLSDNIPPELALRAVLDASGALAHGQRFEQATKILSGAATAELPEEFEPRARFAFA